jgi:(4S)-4-hydroxy-5-phosphonooxypentane-2,3-dione isomerase
MHVTLVHVHVTPEHVDAFAQAAAENAAASAREPGNLRFDVLQGADDATRFILYEAYVDEAAARSHKETDHYLRWRELVAPWMAEPRQGVQYQGRTLATGPADPAVRP